MSKFANTTIKLLQIRGNFNELLGRICAPSKYNGLKNYVITTLYIAEARLRQQLH